MEANRKKQIGQDKVEEFYWAGKMVVYLNNRIQTQTFDELCSDLEDELEYQNDCDHYNTYGYSKTHPRQL